MSSITESNRLNDILKWEAENFLSREKVTVLSGQDLAVGAVIGKITKALAAAAVPVVVGTGNGVMTDLRAGKDVQVGSYVITCIEAVTNGGTFSVVAPDGTVLPDLELTVGAGASTEYKSSHLSFTITDGTTDFVVDDVFTVVVTVGGTPVAVGTGDGVMSAVSLGKNAQNGSYLLTCVGVETHGGTFSIETPNGESLPDFVMSAGDGAATSYAGGHINFTVTDGAADFVLGDTFMIIVAAGSGKVKAVDFTALDGAREAYGFMARAADASLADLEAAAIVRDAIIDDDNLVWPTGATTAQKAAALADLNGRRIISRDSA